MYKTDKQIAKEWEAALDSFCGCNEYRPGKRLFANVETARANFSAILAGCYMDCSIVANKIIKTLQNRPMNYEYSQAYVDGLEVASECLRVLELEIAGRPDRALMGEVMNKAKNLWARYNFEEKSDLFAGYDDETIYWKNIKKSNLDAARMSVLKLRAGLVKADDPLEKKMPSRIYIICNSYESGYGHGLNNDGLDLSKTPHGDPEYGEAYQIGYEAGFEMYQAKQGERGMKWMFTM